jgi:hypothetical protein
MDSPFQPWSICYQKSYAELLTDAPRLDFSEEQNRCQTFRREESLRHERRKMVNGLRLRERLTFFAQAAIFTRTRGSWAWGFPIPQASIYRLPGSHETYFF